MTAIFGKDLVSHGSKNNQRLGLLAFTWATHCGLCEAGSELLAHFPYF
jgi:hypothetical protein